MPPRDESFTLRVSCVAEHYDYLSDEVGFTGDCYEIPCSAEDFSSPGELTVAWEDSEGTMHPAVLVVGRAFVGEPRTRRVAGDAGVLWDRISSLEAALAEKQAALAEKQAELADEQDRLKAAQAELKTVQTELAAAHSELDLTREYTTVLEKQVDDLSAAHDRLASVVADMLPDLVAVCNDDADVHFAFSKNRNNNNIGADAVVQAPNGILMRDMLPEGMDTITLYSMKSCVYLNLTGFARMACTLEDSAASEELLEEPIHLELLAGVTCMNSLEWLQCAALARTDTYGDWSAAPLSRASQVWDAWGQQSTSTSVPCGIDTSRVSGFYALAVNAEKVRRWPDFDVASSVPSNTMFSAWNRECPPTVETRVRFLNIGAVRSTAAGNNSKTWGFELLRNWNLDDMRHSLVEASVYGDTVNRVALHPEAHARLSAEDRARITAKNLTIITRLYCYHE